MRAAAARDQRPADTRPPRARRDRQGEDLRFAGSDPRNDESLHPALSKAQRHRGRRAGPRSPAPARPWRKPAACSAASSCSIRRGDRHDHARQLRIGRAQIKRPWTCAVRARMLGAPAAPPTARRDGAPAPQPRRQGPRRPRHRRGARQHQRLRIAGRIADLSQRLAKTARSAGRRPQRRRRTAAHRLRRAWHRAGRRHWAVRFRPRPAPPWLRAW